MGISIVWIWQIIVPAASPIASINTLSLLASRRLLLLPYTSINTTSLLTLAFARAPCDTNTRRHLNEDRLKDPHIAVDRTCIYNIAVTPAKRTFSF